MLRHAAVAGSWYPARPGELARDIDGYLAQHARASDMSGRVLAVLAPHAGFLYSGSIAGASYAALEGQRPDVVVLLGPSHYVAFDGVAAWPDGAFATPLGELPVAADDVKRLQSVCGLVSTRADAHLQEHSLELQLPFVARLMPSTPIVPLVMGHQARATIEAIATAIVNVFAGRRVVLIASSDLSHFFDATTADRLDGHVASLVARFDTDGLLDEMEKYPYHERGRFVMCGGGPAAAVMKAAYGLGATHARVLARGHSGQVSGDNDRVVGYLAAAFGSFAGAH